MEIKGMHVIFSKTILQKYCRSISWVFLLFYMYLFGCTHVPVSHRIVAIGDVHGDYDDFSIILRKANLTDTSGQWIGGDTMLVQMGDITDRGPDVKRVMDLLISLEKQAPKAGGLVITLMGNHESYNLMGIFDRKSTPPSVFAEICRDFADSSSEARRQNAWIEYRQWQIRYPECAGQTKEEWMQSHPTGFFNYHKALGSSGKYGQWLRSLPAVLKINNIVFVHAGISPELNRLNYIKPERINFALRSEIRAFDHIRDDLVKQSIILPFSTYDEIECAVNQTVQRMQAEAESSTQSEQLIKYKDIQSRLPGTSAWMQLSSEGPLWFRGYAFWSEKEGTPLADEIAEIWEVEHIVVGHTPIPSGRIRSRFNDRVFLIDTGMVYGSRSDIDGRPSALEIKDSAFTAIYEDKVIPLTRSDSNTAASEIMEMYAADRQIQMKAENIPPVKAATDQPASSGIDVWLGVDEKPLPFEDVDALQKFLETADVMHIADLSTGVTRPKKLLLEKNGVRAHTIFHYKHDVDRQVKLKDGTLVNYFRDSYLNQVAAYELSRMLGMTNVPPSILRKIDGKNGAVTLWIENAVNERDRADSGRQPPNRALIDLYAYDMRVFDNLINNIDRNLTNILYDSNWQVWLIDHTRTFGGNTKMPDRERLTHCSYALWEKLKALNRHPLRKALGPYLRTREIATILVRRDHIVNWLEKKMEKEGESAVLFDYPAH